MRQRRPQIPGLGEDETMGQAEAAEKGTDVRYSSHITSGQSHNSHMLDCRKHNKLMAQEALRSNLSVWKVLEGGAQMQPIL